MTRNFFFSATLIAALAVGGCGNDNGTGDGGGGNTPVDAGPSCTPVDPTFTAIFAQIFNTPTCNLAGACHGANPQGDQLYDTDQATAHADISGPTFQMESRTAFPMGVVAGDPDNSFLWIKVSRADAERGRMPLAQDPLNSCQLDAIRTWIENGGQNN